MQDSVMPHVNFGYPRKSFVFGQSHKRGLSGELLGQGGFPDNRLSFDSFRKRASAYSAEAWCKGSRFEALIIEFSFLGLNSTTRS